MSNVIIEHREVYVYPKNAPFRPSALYPEIKRISQEVNQRKNEVYDMVRSCFHLAGYDDENYGKESWNPLGHLIKQGDHVLLKPNMVMDVNGSGEGEDCLYTQPSVVAAVLDYVYIALAGKGKIVVGDAPMQECKFDKLIKDSGYDKLIEWCDKHYEGVGIELIDFRGIKSEVIDGIHRYVEGEQTGIIVNLGENSEFYGMNEYQEKNIRITNYDPDLLKKHHNRTKHEYFISKYVLDADVIINMPKPKTHRKAGVTIALKNLVGINTRKEYLPHHTKGAIGQGGDEYLYKSKLKEERAACLDKRNREAQTKNNLRVSKLWNFGARLWSFIAHVFQKDDFAEGSWHGNNTISKTILDLNKILFYSDKTGKLQASIQRKYLIVADMIISGEKEGPVYPSPKEVGIVAIGENPISFDCIMAKLMGADIDRIPTLCQLKVMRQNKYSLLKFDSDAKIVSNDKVLNDCIIDDIPEKSILHFVPTRGWKDIFK